MEGRGQRPELSLACTSLVAAQRQPGVRFLQLPLPSERRLSICIPSWEVSFLTDFLVRIACSPLRSSSGFHAVRTIDGRDAESRF